MRKYWLTLMACLLSFTTFSFFCRSAKTGEQVINATVVDSIRIKKLSNEAFVYCLNHKFDTSFCFLTDMSIHSGKYRFFVWNFRQAKITARALVTQGCGAGSWGYDEFGLIPTFSNVPDSHCSSLGKYKIGGRGYSDWGIHVKYLLHGLDTSNSNVLKRTIVLHSWEAVQDTEVYPQGSPQSWGCPAVSLNFMRKLDTLLQSTGKPVLMWMVN